jgi:hypothetical protein
MVENDKIGDKTHINKHNIIPGLCEQDRSDLKYWEQRIQVYSTPLVIISQEKRREENINSNTQSRLFDKKFETLRGSEILSIEEYQKIKEWSLKTGLFYFQVKKHQWDLDV